ncbi:MAG: hypothetical protein HZA15_14280 [Nitrospirae bacterium]|nr:hypothetical protein [Nitrospirota bacterium]
MKSVKAISALTTPLGPNEVKLMKQALAYNALDMLQKIESIEKEIVELKLSVLKDITPAGKKIVKLKGILKGIDISDDDISAAKKSLYSKAGI